MLLAVCRYSAGSTGTSLKRNQKRKGCRRAGPTYLADCTSRTATRVPRRGGRAGWISCTVPSQPIWPARFRQTRWAERTSRRSGEGMSPSRHAGQAVYNRQAGVRKRVKHEIDDGPAPSAAEGVIQREGNRHKGRRLRGFRRGKPGVRRLDVPRKARLRELGSHDGLGGLLGGGRRRRS